MQIGIVCDPLNHPLWPQIEAFLEPAAKRGGVPVLEAHETVWAIMDGDLLGAATARLTEDSFGEVILVGGRDCRRWIGQLDWLLGHWMHREGMTSMRAYGRKGWVKVLKNWRVIENNGQAQGYERLLHGQEN